MLGSLGLQVEAEAWPRELCTASVNIPLSLSAKSMSVSSVLLPHLCNGSEITPLLALRRQEFLSLMCGIDAKQDNSKGP